MKKILIAIFIILSTVGMAKNIKMKIKKTDHNTIIINVDKK